MLLVMPSAAPWIKLLPLVTEWYFENAHNAVSCCSAFKIFSCHQIDKTYLSLPQCLIPGLNSEKTIWSYTEQVTPNKAEMWRFVIPGREVYPTHKHIWNLRIFCNTAHVSSFWGCSQLRSPLALIYIALLRYNTTFLTRALQRSEVVYMIIRY